MFSNLELSIIRDAVADSLMQVSEEYKKARREIINRIDLVLTSLPVEPTETPIEKLKSGQIVWDKETGKQETITVFEGRVHIGEKDWWYKKEFYNYYTTIPPLTTTPKPKINRAELLQLVVLTAHDFDNAEKCIKFNIQLLNEVNKVTDGEY